MTKREFTSFINKSLKELRLDQQEELLLKMQHEWMPEISDTFRKKLHKEYIKCNKCRKYSPLKSLRTFCETDTVKDQLVYADAGYGEDDEYADVTYAVDYYICPICKNHIEIKRRYLSEKNRHKPKW